MYFEEWDEPQISGIRWVSELIELAGGEDCFPELAVQALGKNRIIADPTEVVRRAPDIILGSWCGKKFQPHEVAARPGWGDVPAVRDGLVRRLKELGFRFVTLDLEGFRSGSLNTLVSLENKRLYSNP